MNAIPTRDQVSAGGVVFRQIDDRTEVALISVGEEARWQLPKGLLGRDETPEQSALREVQEETGLTAELLRPLDTIEYWYYATTRHGNRVRYHKNVYYFLMRYLSGDTADHDAEVNEARWFEIGEAAQQLAFKNERKVLVLAQEAIAG